MTSDFFSSLYFTKIAENISAPLPPRISNIHERFQRYLVYGTEHLSRLKTFCRKRIKSCWKFHILSIQNVWRWLGCEREKVLQGVRGCTCLVHGVNLHFARVRHQHVSQMYEQQKVTVRRCLWFFFLRCKMMTLVLLSSYLSYHF